MSVTKADAPPGPGFVAGIRLATGVHQTEAFNIAQLLAYHVAPRLAHENVKRIADGMRSFAAVLGLGPADVPPPMIGRRVRIRRGKPWLDYGDDTYQLYLPAAPSWVHLVAAGGPVRICVLFEPLTGGAGQTQTDAHIRRCFARGAMRWGTTYRV